MRLNDDSHCKNHNDCYIDPLGFGIEDLKERHCQFYQENEDYCKSYKEIHFLQFLRLFLGLGVQENLKLLDLVEKEGENYCHLKD